MSWDGDYFSPDGALEKARQVYRDSDRAPEDMVRFASVKYSAANHIAAAVLQCQWPGIRRILYARQLALQAVHMIDAAWLQESEITPYWRTRFDQVDVSCSVWLRWGWLCGGRKDRAALALRCVRSGIDGNVPAHTQAFLIMHQVNTGILDFDEKVVQKIEILAVQTVKYDPHQTVRVYKGLARLFPKMTDERALYFYNAKLLAKRAHSDDQLHKLSAGV